jgi:hypothetical protein
MHKCIFDQAYCEDLLRRIPMKFILYFFKFYFVFYEFLKFILIFGIINKNKKIEKHGRTVLGRTVAHGLGLLA